MSGLAGDRDRHRLRPYRGGDRPRIFPQLDRRSHHLPRLVSALPEGRADGFSRRGVLSRSALARGGADRRRARAALAPVRRGRRSPRPSGATRALSRDQQLLHHDGLRRRRRGRAHDQGPARAGSVSQGHGPLFRPARRRGGDCRAIRAMLRRRLGPGPFAIHAVVHASRHTRSGGGAATTTRTPKPTGSTSRQTVPPTPGQLDKKPMVIPLCRRTSSAKTAAICRSRSTAACCRAAYWK